MLQAINGLPEKTCSARYSPIHCQEALRGLILTRQGDVFGVCNRHATLIERTIEKLGYRVHSRLVPEIDISPFVATGPPKEYETTYQALERDLTLATALANKMGAVNLQLREAVETYRWAMMQLIQEFDLTHLTPEQPAEILAELIGRSRLLVTERVTERQELVRVHEALEEARQQAAFHEAAANELRAEMDR